MSILSLQNITTGYNNKPVLTGLSFDILKPSVNLLIGSNGSGKSTILKTIFGINRIWNSGFISFNNSKIEGLCPKELIELGIIYIPQKNNCFFTLSVMDNIKLAGHFLDKKKLSNRIDWVFEEISSLKELANRYPCNLSGGQRQLLALAMGLVHKPKLVLYDEPSAGLDGKHLSLIYNHIKSSYFNDNVTYLIVEHRLSSILDISDRIIGIKNGRVELDMNGGDVIDPTQDFSDIYL